MQLPRAHGPDTHIGVPAAGRDPAIQIGNANGAVASLEEDFFHAEGDTLNGGFVVSRFADRVDWYDQLNNRIVNLVPVENLLDAMKWCDDTTQTVGVYPESARERVVDAFSLVGVQRMVPLKGGDPMQIFTDMHTLPPGMPHDGIEPMRRNVRWVIDHRPVEEPAVRLRSVVSN